MTTDSQAACTVDTKPAGRRRFLRPRWVVLTIVLICVLCLLRFAYLRLTLVPTPRREYWENRIAALDPPGEGALAPSEVWDLLSNPPWEGNAAVKASEEAFDREFLAGPWKSDRLAVIAAESVFTSDAYREKQAAIREALQAGWSDGGCLTGATPSWRWYQLHGTWAWWLVGHSRWTREQEHPIEETVGDWITALRLGRQLSRTRVFGGTWYMWNSHMLIAREMILTAREPHARIDTLALAAQVYEVIGPIEKPSEFLEGERLRLHALLDHMYVREGGDWLAVSHARMANPYSSGTPASRLWNLASPLFHDFAAARRRVDDYFAALDAVDCLITCPEVTPVWERSWHELRPNALEGFEGYSSSRAPHQFLGRYYDTRTRMEAAIAMLALAEFRRAHDRYPKELAELTPDFLERVPLDYADCKPLRYRRLEGDYLLYSVHKDGRDNGGQGGGIVYDRGFRYEHDGPDVVFSRSKRPDLRK
ncbi:MAG: hypothetical protein ABII12_10225 [Planctomycetota bacterium]